jgi:hypothetical protein
MALTQVNSKPPSKNFFTLVSKLGKNIGAAVKAQYWLMKKGGIVRYTMGTFIPLGETIHDVFTGWDPMKEESIITAYKRYQALQQKHGLETQPLLLRAFSREWRQEAVGFQKLPLTEQRESYGQKAAALGKYLSELKTMNAKAKLAARFARGEKLQAQRVLAGERRKPVEIPKRSFSLDLQPRPGTAVAQRVLQKANLPKRQTGYQRAVAVGEKPGFSDHFNRVSTVKIQPRRTFYSRAA